MPRDLLLHPEDMHSPHKAKPVPTPSERLIQRGATGKVVAWMTHTNNKGKRVPGWEEVDFEKLAKALGLGAHYVRMGLTGRDYSSDKGPSFTMRWLLAAADLLGLSIAEIGARIDYTRKIDAIRSDSGVDWHEANAMLEGRKTDGQLRKEQRAARPLKDITYPKPRTAAGEILNPTQFVSIPIANRKGF